MPTVIKEYICPGHGAFSSTVPVCPHGCTLNVERRFFTAPGLKSTRTSNVDRMLRAVAADFGLTDMSNRNGSVAQGKRKQPDFKPVWGEVPKGDTFKGDRQGGGVVEKAKGSMGGMNAAIAGYRVDQNAYEGEIKPMELVRELTPPRPVVSKRLTYGTAEDLKAAMKSV